MTALFTEKLHTVDTRLQAAHEFFVMSVSFLLVVMVATAAIAPVLTFVYVPCASLIALMTHQRLASSSKRKAGADGFAKGEERDTKRYGSESSAWEYIVSVLSESLGSGGGGSGGAGLTSVRAFHSGAAFACAFERALVAHAAHVASRKATGNATVLQCNAVGAICYTAVAVAVVANRHTIAPGHAGFCVSNACWFSLLTNMAIQSRIEIQEALDAGRQLLQAARGGIPVEAPVRCPHSDPPSTTNLRDRWPMSGKIEIRDLTLRYDSTWQQSSEDPHKSMLSGETKRREVATTAPPPDTEEGGEASRAALFGVSFVVPPGSRLGIVGRTGSGKSSLLSAIARLFEPSRPDSSILIDDVDVLNIGLGTLRKALTVISQDVFVFSGSWRDNLDPFDDHDDEALWHALAQTGDSEMAVDASTSAATTKGGEEIDREENFCAYREHDRAGNLHAFVSALPQKLDEPIPDLGANLSKGQLQLLCLARALLRCSAGRRSSAGHVLLVDEATASLDAATDATIQRTIATSEAFRGVTMIVIAHRLDTVLNCDNILVMDAGEAVEYGTPTELLQRPPKKTALPKSIWQNRDPLERGYGLFAGMVLAAKHGRAI